MKRHFINILALLLCAINIFAIGCDNQDAHSCDYIVTSAEAQYLKSESTCTTQAEYYYSCSCGKKGKSVFTYGELADHDFSLEIAQKKYLKNNATTEIPATYYKSCVCGKMGKETFTYGEKLSGLSEKEKALYKPTSLTITLYDTLNSIYGFTFNTVNKPMQPLIQIRKVDTEEWSEYPLSSEAMYSFNKDGLAVTYYYSKTEISLEPSTAYVYRAYDKGADVGTAETTLITKDPNASTFTFVHVSDSQDGPNYFNRVLSAITDNADFLLHTGDVVEWSKYEEEWTAMLDGNYKYLSQIPIMAISGNHETSYRNGLNETFKHFNNIIPTQASTDIGYFYSFIYGDMKFIMLNTNDLSESKLKDEQYHWLINELETNTCKWTVVAMHHPVYSVGNWGADSTKNMVSLALREQLNDIFVQYGVDIVLQGHDHTVSRTFPIDENGVPKTETFETVNGVDYSVNPDGVIYLMNGPAGSQIRAPYAVDDTLYAYAGTSKAASWAELTFDGDTLTVTVKWHDGTKENVYYTWGIKKTSEQSDEQFTGFVSKTGDCTYVSWDTLLGE